MLNEIPAIDTCIALSSPAAVPFAAGDVGRGFEPLAVAVRDRDQGAPFLLSGQVLGKKVVAQRKSHVNGVTMILLT